MQGVSTDKEVVVWDPLVRSGHWLLVLAFTIAYLTEEELLTVHSWAGYLVAAIVVVRVVWGFIGPRFARFSDFVYRPARVLAYLGELLTFRARRYLGHSPTGGVMVIALLLVLAATTVSGMAVLAIEENAGPLAHWLGHPAATVSNPPGQLTPAVMRFPSETGALTPVNGEEELEGEHEFELLEELHEFLANVTLVLVIVHIGGVLFASLVHRENLVWAMVTGRKRALKGSGPRDMR